jgi:hypothetical protein
MSFAEKVQAAVEELETWHASSLQAYLKCGEAYRRRYVEHDYVPATTPQIRGSAVHRAIGEGLLLQQRTQEPSPVELYEDIAASQIDLAQRGGATLTAEESSAGVAQTFGLLKDVAVDLAGGYGTAIGPAITPVAVERTVTVRGVLPGILLKGTIDLIDQTPLGEVIRDVKTSEKKPPETAAETSDQLTMYALFRQADKPHAGEPVVWSQRPVSLDYLIRRKSGVVETQRLTSWRGPAHFAALTRRIAQASNGVRQGNFLPAPEGSWYCAERYCPYWHTCPYIAHP